MPNTDSHIFVLGDCVLNTTVGVASVVYELHFLRDWGLERAYRISMESQIWILTQTNRLQWHWCTLCTSLKLVALTRHGPE